MGTGNMRYWSICSYELFSQKVAGCLFDQTLKTDSAGNYVIAVSRSADRPSNANAACGYNWIQWSDNGDGNGNTNDGFIALRNLLPDPSFGQSVQNAALLGIGAPLTMGAYLPAISYSSVSAFQARGCSP